MSKSKDAIGVSQMYDNFELVDISADPLNAYFAECVTMRNVYNDIKSGKPISDIVGFCHYDRIIRPSAVDADDIMENGRILWWNVMWLSTFKACRPYKNYVGLLNNWTPHGNLQRAMSKYCQNFDMTIPFMFTRNTFVMHKNTFCKMWEFTEGYLQVVMEDAGYTYDFEGFKNFIKGQSEIGLEEHPRHMACVAEWTTSAWVLNNINLDLIKLIPHRKESEYHDRGMTYR